MDNIASYFLKVAFPVISDSLCDILNLPLSSAVLPDSWKVARLAPIFKEGPSCERSNYRPISVLPAVSRLHEKLVYDHGGGGSSIVKVPGDVPPARVYFFGLLV